MVDEAVTSAVKKHITNTQDILDYVKNYLVDRANNFKCEDVLTTKVSQLVMLRVFNKLIYKWIALDLYTQ